MLPIVFAALTFISTLLGGIFALKHRRNLGKILAFTAGVLLAVVAFDLLPEIFSLANELKTDISTPMVALVVGFLTFYLFENLLFLRNNHNKKGKRSSSSSLPSIGIMQALALCGDSFLDGVGIGLAFQVNVGVGIVVALAVLMHDFTDGLNTVTLMLVNHNTSRKAVALLIADALAPAIGVLSVRYIKLDQQQLVLYLGFFAGFLLYIGAADILPRAKDRSFSKITLGLTIFGVLLTYALLSMIDSIS